MDITNGTQYYNETSLHKKIDSRANYKETEIWFDWTLNIGSVVYFNQHLDAEHSRCWSKYAFLTFLMAKGKKKRKKHKICSKILHNLTTQKWPQRYSVSQLFLGKTFMSFCKCNHYVTSRFGYISYTYKNGM